MILLKMSKSSKTALLSYDLFKLEVLSVYLCNILYYLFVNFENDQK